jgi:putative heme-binding domain-containing protein
MIRVVDSRVFIPLCVSALSVTVLCASALAQALPSTNPMANNAKAIEQGKHLFRGRCAVCHGLDARGYRGTDLTTNERTLTSTDAQLHRLISRGIPGTEMPGSTMHDDELWMVIAYIRTLADPASGKQWPGDAANGERLFWSAAKGNCGLCHMVRDRGGRFGPNLTRIGASRSRAALVREIRRSNEVIPVGFETVRVVTRDSRRIVGIRKNEDTFTLLMMTQAGDILSFMKRDLKELVEDPKSLMPDYGTERFADAELDDLLRYLQTLRGPMAAVTSSQH